MPVNRNITWADLGAPFMTYLARASYMLQQGLFVADLAYLLNEGAPSTPPIWGPGTMPPPPEGHDYDFVNADVLLSRMSVDTDGRLTLVQTMPSGGRTPRFFAVTPDGRWLYVLNEDSDSIRLFRIDADSGQLSDTGQAWACGSPVCMVFANQAGQA